MKRKKRSLVRKMADYDWNDLIAAGSGLVKSIPDSPKELLISGVTTSLDYVLVANKGILKEKFTSDITKLVEKGDLDQGFLNDDLTRKTFTEIAEIIDRENPSSDKIDAMKALLVAVAGLDQDETKRYEISTHLSTLKQLDSVELNILMASYRIRKNDPGTAKTTFIDQWRRAIAGLMKWDDSMIYEIERRESHLVEMRLIDSPPGQDKNRITESANFRLTGLAIKIGDIITNKD